MIDYDISPELIKQARAAGLSQDCINWLEEKPRTWKELKAHDTWWAMWMLINIPELPVDLEGLDGLRRALVMIYHPDCPIDLTGLDSQSRALVMAKRPDCPIDLKGLDDEDRDWVLCERGQEESE